MVRTPRRSAEQACRLQRQGYEFGDDHPSTSTPISSGSDGPATRAPTLATLAGLLRAHMRRIPFENLDVLLGNGPSDSISMRCSDKLVHARRGGYCFEHATLVRRGARSARVLRRSRHIGARRPVRAAQRGAAHAHVPDRAACRRHVRRRSRFRRPRARYVRSPSTAATRRRDAPATHGRTGWRATARRGCCAREAAARSSMLGRRRSKRTIAVDFVVGNHYTATHPASPFRQPADAARADRRTATCQRDESRRHASVRGASVRIESSSRTARRCARCWRRISVSTCPRSSRCACRRSTEWR